MSKIILDFGSGNTHENNWGYLKKMFDELKAIDTGKHEIVIKHQLFKKAGNNMPLNLLIFDAAYDYAKELGYKTTSSVFDKESLKFLLDYDVPFIKIANRRDLDWLIGEVPRKIPVYVSVGSMSEGETLLYSNGSCVNQNRDVALFCVSQYPASIEEYEGRYSKGSLKHGISDHTIGLELFKTYQPRIWEKHYVLEHDVNNLDGGLFATTPNELKEIL